MEKMQTYTTTKKFSGTTAQNVWFSSSLAILLLFETFAVIRQKAKQLQHVIFFLELNQLMKSKNQKPPDTKCKK